MHCRPDNATGRWYGNAGRIADQVMHEKLRRLIGGRPNTAIALRDRKLAPFGCKLYSLLFRERRQAVSGARRVDLGQSFVCDDHSKTSFHLGLPVVR